FLPALSCPPPSGHPDFAKASSAGRIPAQGGDDIKIYALTYRRGGVIEQADFEVLGFVDHLAVHFDSAIGHAQYQLAVKHAFDIDDIAHQLVFGQYLSREFQLA